MITKAFSTRVLFSALIFIFSLAVSNTAFANYSLSVVAGQSVTFSVTANGTAPFAYQWYKNGTAISNATGQQYSISSATTADTNSYTATVTNQAGSTSSDTAYLTVNAVTATSAPTITTQPTAQTVTVGQSATFKVVATGTGTLSYQWTKGGTAISGATSASYTISSTASSDAGSYAVKVTNSVSSVTSNSAALVVSQGSPNPDGSAASATGGAAGQTVSVLTAADLKTYAQATAPYVINVSGVINLGGSVSVKSNKTIQGVDSNATIVGCLDLSSGSVNNVILRGLNITNPGTTIVNGAYTDGGDGIIIRNASNVFVTHCSLFDCAGDQIEISHGSDYVTVSWSEFYYTSAQTAHRSSLITGIAGSETKPLHITLHHNFWSDSCDQHMPSGTYGYVHLFNNSFSAPGNTSTTDARDYSQFFVEYNAYKLMNDPLYKENVDTTLPAGRILSIGNQFTGCTGKTPDAGADAVFTPAYSYELLPAADVAMVTAQLAGNTAGSYSGTPASSSASISGPTDVVVAGTAFTLTAAPSGFTGVSYQWRLNNFAISGATASTYSVSSAQSTNVGTYTVVIGLAAGDYVVSSPLTLTLGASGGSSGSGSSSGSTAAASSGGGGGGGAPSVWYLAVIGALAIARARKKFAR